jgi:hypothetical protein
MPFAAERLGGGGSSGHPVANSLTSHMLLPHSEHSYQHPAVSQTAQTAPHTPVGLSLKLAIPLQLSSSLHYGKHMPTYVRNSAARKRFINVCKIIKMQLKYYMRACTRMS